MVSIPASINPLSPNGFNFSITKLPGITYFSQEVDLPTISLNPISVASPVSTFFVPEDVLSYAELTVQFIVDEDMSNYKAIQAWLVGLGHPEDHYQYTKFLESDPMASKSELSKNSSDAVLQILGSNNLPTQTVFFKDCFPTSLSTLQFTSTASDVTYLVGTATFRYDFYRFD